MAMYLSLDNSSDRSRSGADKDPKRQTFGVTDSRQGTDYKQPHSTRKEWNNYHTKPALFIQAELPDFGLHWSFHNGTLQSPQSLHCLITRE